ncbi:MAG: DM13 domain-containing protein [Gammaproteobacteria bacterium]
MNRLFTLAISHTLVAAAGFAAGIYALPILTAPEAPSNTEMAAALGQAEFTGEFKRELADSDLLHWGEGTVSVGRQFISLHGRIAPGPDYKLYLSPAFVETEAEFIRRKEEMVHVGDVRTFENFVVPVPESVDPAAFNTVVVWCESFGQFITAAKYQ